MLFLLILIIFVHFVLFYWSRIINKKINNIFFVDKKLIYETDMI